MQGGAVPFFLAFVLVIAGLAWFVDRWEFYRFTDKESAQFCKPAVNTGTQAFGRDAAYLEPAELQVHDVVRFKVARVPGAGQTLRIVATEGQRVAIDAGQVKVDGKPFEDPHARYRLEDDHAAEVIVPAGCVYVLGDERRSSGQGDSRALGPIPVGAILYDFGPREAPGGRR